MFKHITLYYFQYYLIISCRLPTMNLTNLTSVFVNKFSGDANKLFLRFYCIKLSPTQQIRRVGVNFTIHNVNEGQNVQILEEATMIRW